MKKLILVSFLVMVFTLSFAQEALFEVKNDVGVTIFSVTPNGIEIMGMSLNATTDGSSFQLDDATGQALFVASPDSVRFYMYEGLTDEGRGGFAIATVGSTTDILGSNLIDLTPENYFIGHKTGYSISTGTKNLFIGYQAGYSNTTGWGNLFIGEEAGYTNTTGYYNLFQGYNSGYYNLSGNYNQFIGFDAGRDNTTGSYNTMLGHMAGKLNITGNNNICIGAYSGFENEDGDDNLFIGQYSGRKCGQGGVFTYRNVFIGSWSGYESIDASSCVNIGYSSGRWYDDQLRNTFVGYEAGQGGSVNAPPSTYEDTQDNSFFGSGAGTMNLANYNSFFGSGAGSKHVEGNLNCYFGAQSGNDMGSTLPTPPSDIGNSFFGARSAYDKTSGDNNTFIGYYSGAVNADGANNVFIGKGSGRTNTGSSNVFIGYEAGENATGSNQLYIENSYSDTPLIHGDFSTDVVTINDVLKLAPRSTNPSSATEGMMYYNSSTHKLMVYDGSTWQACW